MYTPTIPEFDLDTLTNAAFRELQPNGNPLLAAVYQNVIASWETANEKGSLHEIWRWTPVLAALEALAITQPGEKR